MLTKKKGQKQLFKNLTKMKQLINKTEEYKCL